MVVDALKCAQWQLFVLTSAAHEIDRRRGSEAMTPATGRTEIGADVPVANHRAPGGPNAASLASRGKGLNGPEMIAWANRDWKR